MNGFIDIHTHILPGVDDGSKSMEQTLSMLKQASENGITVMIATPHYKEGQYEASPDHLRSLLHKVREQSGRQGSAVRILPGNEILYSSGVPERLGAGKLCTLAGSSFVLLEFLPAEDFGYLWEAVNEVLGEGYKPIIAHVERYGCLLEKKERVQDLRSLGALIQVNAGSVLGDIDGRGKRFCRYLLKNRQVDFVATDAHSDGKRGPYLKECALFLQKKYGRVYAEELLFGNARRYLLSGLEQE